MISVVLVLAAAAAGCGESEVKRSVDARTEVLHYFSADAPIVGILQPRPAGDLIDLDAAAVGIPIWEELRSKVRATFRAAGLGPAELRRLTRPQEQIEGIEAAALAFGAPTPSDLEAGQTLLVLATDQDELFEELLVEGVDSGDLQTAGSLDEAALYSNDVASYAERDGVLVSAPSLGVVRSAVARRDGDSDEQLDEDVVRSLFNNLGDQGPLLVYANFPKLPSEPEVPQPFASRSFLDKVADGAAFARAQGGLVEVEAVISLEEDLEPAERPLEEEPGTVAFQISGLGAFDGVGSASEDEVRLQLRTAP
jgi:hypothetical protein